MEMGPRMEVSADPERYAGRHGLDMILPGHECVRDCNLTLEPAPSGARAEQPANQLESAWLFLGARRPATGLIHSNREPESIG